MSPGALLIDAVSQRLISEIVDGRLKPGQRIRQAELAERMGVSRAPVSHALHLLKQRGLVRESGKMGVEVVPVSADRVRDLYQIRARLDGLAARLAAARMKVGDLRSADIGALRKAFEKGVESITPDHPLFEQVKDDVAFHRKIYEVCGNTSIALVMDPLWSHVQRAMVLVLEQGEGRARAWEDHRILLDHILAGRPDEAEEHAFQHAAQAGQFTENRLRGHGVQ